MKTKFLVFYILILSFSACAQESSNKLVSKQEFDKFSGLPLSEKYGQVSAVKIVYDLRSKKLYFINGNTYKYHFDFCKTIGAVDDLVVFNELNYSNTDKRRFLLANINYFKALNKYVLELAPADLMPISDILKLYRMVNENTYIGNNLYFLLNNPRLQNENFNGKIPIIQPSAIYENLKYQAISKNKTTGILRFITNLESEKALIKPTDIVVLNETPLYLPEVAGIIVTEFQTPLSHLTILGQNRRIPISAYKNAFADKNLLRFQDKKISYEVRADTFFISSVKEIISKNKRNNTIKLKYDLTVKKLIDVADLNTKSYQYVGNKAANFGILYKLSKGSNFKTPESAFAIPFYYYQQHIENSKASALIEKLLVQDLENLNKESLAAQLKAIQKEISSQKLNTELLKLVETKILSQGKYTKMRFRSSTNAEDAKGFSGAGLYTSKSGVLGDSIQTIEKAIKKVWASLWSFQAFAERQYFGMNHRNVFMGVLVHRSFPNEAVNGVAITKNLYRLDNYGFVVNAQLGNANVVKPGENEISEQFICYPNNIASIYSHTTVDIITLSNLNEGNMLMTEKEIQNLANQLEKIKMYFYRKSFSSIDYLKFGLDIEFKIEKGTRDLYLKQVRLYND